MADPYPSTIPGFLRAGKARSQPAAFRLNQPRRGFGYAEATGTDTPVFWNVTFRFTTAQARIFRQWFNTTLQRGVLEFDTPIKTEFGFQTYTCRFMPESLLDTSEDGDVWTYSATLMARALITPAP